MRFWAYDSSIEAELSVLSFFLPPSPKTLSARRPLYPQAYAWEASAEADLQLLPSSPLGLRCYAGKNPSYDQAMFYSPPESTVVDKTSVA